MARPPRLLLPGLPHHLILRGNNRRRLFSYQRDYQRFILLLGRALNQFDCRLNALTLMTNHVHLIAISPTGDGLSQFVKSFAQRYAQHRNRARGASGKLFEERFRSIPILTDDQLAVTTAYIDLNPTRAGIVQDPIDYRWSTCALHNGSPEHSGIPCGLWTPSDWYLSLGTAPSARAAAYADWLTACRSNDTRPKSFNLCAVAEALSSKPYTRRLQRPDGSSAAEGQVRYRALGKKDVLL